MRDAFGGVFMMRLMLVFITVFVAFSAVSLNYAKAFRIKNKVIDVIEQLEIQQVKDISNYYDRLDNIKENAKYNIECNKEGTLLDENGKQYGVCRSGIVIKINKERTNSKYIYYDVITYGGWDLSILNALLALGGKSQNSEDPMMGSWAITGEAKVRNNTKDVTPIQPGVAFSNEINGDRCYMGAWIRVEKCQPRKKSNGENDPNAQCWINDNGERTLVLRNNLTLGSGCDWVKSEYYDKINGYRCNKETGEKYYIESCQLRTIKGARCKVRGGEPIIRTFLKMCG